MRTCLYTYIYVYTHTYTYIYIYIAVTNEIDTSNIIQTGRRTRGVRIDYTKAPKPEKDDFLSALCDSDSD